VIDVEPLLAVQRASYAAATPGLRSVWPEEQALGAEEMAGLLDRHRYCVLATARRDGRPHAAPVAFAVSGGGFWFATVPGLRLRNLRVNRWASLVVMEGQSDHGEPGEPHRALTAEGPVTLHGVQEAYESLRERWLARHRHAPDWADAFVELRPERVFSHGAR
jgi:hypothetical protein